MSKNYAFCGLPLSVLVIGPQQLCLRKLLTQIVRFSSGKGCLDIGALHRVLSAVGGRVYLCVDMPQSMSHRSYACTTYGGFVVGFIAAMFLVPLPRSGYGVEWWPLLVYILALAATVRGIRAPALPARLAALLLFMALIMVLLLMPEIT